MTFDMNDAQPQMSGELIPDGSFAKVNMTLRRGGADGDSEIDRGLLKASTAPGSDVKSLDCEFTVTEGPYARRKFWQMFTVSGGKVDDGGVSIGWKISKGSFRAMIDSALGLDPRDETPAARQKRVIQGLKQLDGIVFAARIMIEPASDPQYKDANKLANVVLPGEPHYAAIMRGESVTADPVNARPRKAPSAVQQTPGWSAPAATSDKPWTGPATAAAAAPAPAAPTGPQWLNG